MVVSNNVISTQYITVLNGKLIDKNTVKKMKNMIFYPLKVVNRGSETHFKLVKIEGFEG